MNKIDYSKKYIEHLLNNIVWNLTTILEEENEINEGVFNQREYDRIIDLIKIIEKELEKFD